MKSQREGLVFQDICVPGQEAPCTIQIHGRELATNERDTATAYALEDGRLAVIYDDPFGKHGGVLCLVDDAGDPWGSLEACGFEWGDIQAIQTALGGEEKPVAVGLAAAGGGNG